MPRITRAALIQASLCERTDAPFERIRSAMTEKHVGMIEQAAAAGAQVCCLQELFNGPYFCAEQQTRWYDFAEPVPDGPTTRLMCDLARRLKMVLIVPIYERAMAGLFYNTSVVIDEDGAVLGLYRKTHLPHCHPGFWEKFYFRPGDLGYPVFRTRHGVIGVYTCYDRHFPEGWRALGLAGAEIVFNPSATVAGLSEYLWKLEQPANAAANQFFVGAINRVGWEEPWRVGEFYGQSYFCDPRGKIVAQSPRDRDDVLIADLDLSLIDEVRATWQWYRDRRPETYGVLTDPAGRA